MRLAEAIKLRVTCSFPSYLIGMLEIAIAAILIILLDLVTFVTTFRAGGQAESNHGSRGDDVGVISILINQLGKILGKNNFNREIAGNDGKNNINYISFRLDKSASGVL